MTLWYLTVTIHYNWLQLAWRTEELLKATYKVDGVVNYKDYVSDDLSCLSAGFLMSWVAWTAVVVVVGRLLGGPLMSPVKLVAISLVALYCL